MKTNLFSQDRGSALIEVVAFAFVGFGLVLTLGFDLLEQERKVLALEGIARNTMRSFLLNSSDDMFEEVARQQESSQLWKEEPLDVSMNCSPTNCSLPNSLIWLRIKAGDLEAKAFGVRGG